MLPSRSAKAPPATFAELAEWAKKNPKQFGYNGIKGGMSGVSFVAGWVYAFGGDAEKLMETFAMAQAERDTFIVEPRPRRVEGERPDVRQELMNSLMGGWIADRLKRARELPDRLREPGQTPNEGGRGRAERIAEAFCTKCGKSVADDGCFGPMSVQR